MARRIIDTDYKAVDGTGWSVEVWDLYSSAPNRDLKVEMMSPGFNLTWNGDENNVLQPLLGSACSLTLALTETHRDILMPLIYSEEEFRLALLLRKENQVYWVGQIHTEECVELITDGYITVDITASDGLAQLENIDFKSTEGNPYSGRLRAIRWVHKILLKVPSIGLWYSQYQPGSVFAYEHHLNTPVLDGDNYQFNYTGNDNVVRGVLDYIYVTPSCWYLRPPEKDKVGDEFKRYPTTAKDGFVSCKMVLSDIMAAIGATICFSDGAWRIFDRTYLFSESASLSSSNVIQYTATETGFLEATIFQEQIDVDVDASTSEFFRGAVRKGLHPFAGSTQVHKNAGADLVYASGVNYSIPPNKPIYKFVTGYGMQWASSALVRPVILFEPDQSNLFPYRDDPTISDLVNYMPDSGIFNFAGLTPIGSPSIGELQLPNGQGGGQIRINIAARALYKVPGEVGDTLANNYVCRPGAMALLSFRFSVTDSNGVKYYLKRRVRTLNRYTNGQEVEINLTGPHTIPDFNDPDYGEDIHYKPKYYESDYYTWVATTDDYSNLAWVDIMLGGDPSVLESGVSDEFLTYEFPGSAQYTPPLTRINPSSSTDGELSTDFDYSKRNFEIRFDHAIFLPDNSGTIESCELESMWIEEHDANGGPAAMRNANGDLYATPTTYVKTPSYRTEKTPTGNDGIFNTTYFNHPRSLLQFELREIEIHAGDGLSNYDSVNTFIPTTVYGNETYSSPDVFAGGGSLDLSGNQYRVGRYAAKSYSQLPYTDPSLYFKMSTQWDSSDLADRMTHRVNKNVMQIRHRVRELVEASLFSSTSNGVILEPWQRLVTKKFQGTVIETFVPFRLSLEFSQAEQRLTLLKCRSESATLPGEADDKDIPRGNRPSGGTSNPIGPVHFLSSKVIQNEDDIISIYSKTNLITITQGVNLDTVESDTNQNSTDINSLQSFQTAVERLLKSSFTNGGAGIYEDAGKATTSSYMGLTSTTAHLQAGTNTYVDLTETSPGNLDFYVQAGAVGSEAAFKAVAIDGSSTSNTATVAFNASTVGIQYSDISGTPSVPSSIDDLSDVDTTTTTPTNGDALVWDNSASKWVPDGTGGSGGGGSDSFNTIQVSGQSDVVADSGNDTLTLVAGSNLLITTDATTDTITYATSQSPTFTGTATIAGIALGSTGILGTGGISTTGSISTLGSGNISSAGTLNVTGNATFNSNLYAQGIQFTGSGTNIIGPSGTGGTQDDLEIRSNGNITAVLDYDSDEAAQAFIVKNQAGTIIFQVDEDGISSGLFTSATPSLATVSNWENSQTGTLTISNYVSSATYEVKLYNSSNVEQTSQTITNNNDGTFSITSAPVLTGAYFTVRSVEFGELVSQTATSNTFNITAPATSKRYWRLQMTDANKNPVSSKVALGNFRLYTATGGGGTAYPSNMTNNSSPTPYVATGGYKYSNTYDYWYAFDSNIGAAGSMWWTLGLSTASNNWIQIDLGSSVEMGSGECQIRTSGGWTDANYAVLYGSDTGDFTGEEREMAFFQNIDKAGESGGTFTTYTESIT